MTTTTNFHYVKSFEAKGYKGSAWLAIADHDGNKIAIFMEAHEAEALAAAWEDVKREKGGDE